MVDGTYMDSFECSMEDMRVAEDADEETEEIEIEED